MTAAAAPSEISVGDTLPAFTVLLTLQRLVMEAGANRDFSAIHFDRDAARASGAPDVYTNTTFIETLLEAAVRSWAGLAARIRVIEFAMRDFNLVGEEVAAGGAVTSVRREGGDLTVELAIWVESPRGRTVTGSATVVLPVPEP